MIVHNLHPKLHKLYMALPNHMIILNKQDAISIKKGSIPIGQGIVANRNASLGIENK